MIKYGKKPYAGSDPRYKGLYYAAVSYQGIIGSAVFEKALAAAGYHSRFCTVIDRHDIFERVLMTFVKEGMKVIVDHVGIFYARIRSRYFHPEQFNEQRDIISVYVCRQPHEVIYQEIAIDRAGEMVCSDKEETGREGSLFG